MSRVCDLTKTGVLFGNKVVPNSQVKTKRRFFPNLQNIKLKSEVLNLNFNLRVATGTLRTINKYGSLDSFLINYGANKLSDKGKQLRTKVKQKLVETNEYADVKILAKKKIRKVLSKRRSKKKAEQQAV
jgi:large subunit ribosomal protein L28